MCHQWRLKNYQMQTPCRCDPVFADIFEEKLAIAIVILDSETREETSIKCFACHAVATCRFYVSLIYSKLIAEEAIHGWIMLNQLASMKVNLFFPHTHPPLSMCISQVCAHI